MAFFIAIETATKVCSVALFEGEKLIAKKEEHGDYSHAENLAVFVDALMKDHGLEYSQLQAIAVSKGPGSYTGLRIGVSFAKGLCFSLQIPLIAIDTLQAMAWGAKKLISDSNGLLCPMIDARRMEVYSAIYDLGLNVVKPISAEIVDDGSYREYLADQKVYFFGDGAAKCADVLNHPHVNILSQSIISAENMGELAMDKLNKQEVEDVAYFEPYYLKEFIALKGKKLV